MEFKDFDVLDDFLHCLEAQGHLLAFANLGLNVAMTMVSELYHIMNR